MRIYPDKWELTVTGITRHNPPRVDTPVPGGYDSEQAARRAFREMQRSTGVTYTSAVIQPPLALGRGPIYLVRPR